MRIPATALQKKLIVFDLDGTLAVSKQAIDPEMSALIIRLLDSHMVAVISGGNMKQFKKQILSQLKAKSAHKERLFLFPVTATAFYRYKKGWKEIYALHLGARDKATIMSAIPKALRDIGYKKPAKVYGKTLEDRGTQITFSALGQKAPVEAKVEWNKNDQRPQIIKAIKRYVKGFEVRSGGLTSIDITMKGIDKAYGLRQIKKHVGVPISDMLFVGDAIFKGGNDYAALKTGVDYVQVKDEKETKELITFLIKG